MMELGEKTTPLEMAYWVALSRIMPLGPMNDNANAGMIAFWAAHAFSGSTGKEDMSKWIPDYFKRDKPVEDVIRSDQNKFMFFTTAVGGKINTQEQRHRRQQRRKRR